MKPKFIKLSLENLSERHYAYITAAIDLMFKNKSVLFDDFLNFTDENRLEKGLGLIRHFSPFFWAIICPQTAELAGVVYLYNVVGGQIQSAKKGNMLHSAYVSVCFKRKFWGDFVLRSKKQFFRYIFGKLKFYKLFAEIYATNRLGLRFVEKLGFKPMCRCEAQTLKDGRLADTVLYSTVRGSNKQKS